MADNIDQFQIENQDDLVEFVDRLMNELDDMDDSDIGEVYEHVALANYVFQNTSETMYSIEYGSISGSRSTTLKNRLQNWINMLKSKVQTIAQNQGAESFSVSVSTPWSIGVSVSFKP